MFFVLDENNNKVEAFDKEGVLNAIETAIKDGSLANLVADAAFVSKLKCCVSGQANKTAFVTQAQYNTFAANGTLQSNTLYYIIDDTSIEDTDEALTELNNAVSELVTKLNELTETVAEHKSYANSKFNALNAKVPTREELVSARVSVSDNPVTRLYEGGTLLTNGILEIHLNKATNGNAPEMYEVKRVKFCNLTQQSIYITTNCKLVLMLDKNQFEQHVLLAFVEDTGMGTVYIDKVYYETYGG